jgi:carboxyl-terminal processing protease
MRKDRVEGIILDLRGNGGGSLMEAVRITGLFVRSGPVVQVAEKGGIRVLRDKDEDVAFAGPMVVLVDRLSASASEIVAGALQDYRRAVIVGDRKTHGKGTVQTVQDVARDSRYGAIKVTSSMFYRVSGRSTQLKGVEADIPIPSPFDCLEFGEESIPNALNWSAIRGTSFSPAGITVSEIGELKARSEQRRKADPRFLQREQVVARICELNGRPDAPLDRESRRETIGVEKELLAIQESLSPERAGDEKRDQTDLVLEEGLRILRDLAELEERAANAGGDRAPVENARALRKGTAAPALSE